MDINGIKEATAFRFLAINELVKRKGLCSSISLPTDSESIAKRYRYIIGYNKTESMYLIAISEKGNLLFERELYIGTKKNIVSNEDEIIDTLKRERATFFIIVHNHPSGCILPSDADKLATAKIIGKAKDHGLVFLDHIIVSSNENYYSFKDNHDLL